MDKRKLSETDIISKFILPAVKTAGWNDITQIRQEVKLRDGKVIVRGQLGVRKTVKSADIVLYHKPSMPLAVIEAKANKHEVGKGLQQGLDYARLLDVPFIFASNGDGFIFDNQMLSQIIMAGYDIGEISCPTKYFEEASSINFKRSTTYGLGVIKTSIMHFFQRNGLTKFSIYKKPNS